jgi:hypothetical protein
MESDVEAQPQKGNAHSSTIVVVFSSTNIFGITRNIHELGQEQVEQLIALWQ